MTIGAHWRPIQGVSMWPIAAPLWCRVSRCHEPAVGDLVVFLGDDRRVWIHRVKRQQADHIITRGDTQGWFDQPVPRSAIVGRVDQIALGPLALSFPVSGPVAWLQRNLGTLWAQIAPTLRICYRHLRKV